MHEIAPNIYYETSYAGVTLGAINWPHGLILLDAPFRPEDARSWRSALLNLGGGVDRMLINLDAHPDRTLGARSMDCTIVGHDKMAGVFRNRPVSFKSQSGSSGADWEAYNGLGTIRWAPPDLTFSEQMEIHWNQSPLLLEYHPGSATGSIWAVLPEEQVVLRGMPCWSISRLFSSAQTCRPGARTSPCCSPPVFTATRLSAAAAGWSHLPRLRPSWLTWKRPRCCWMIWPSRRPRQKPPTA